MYCKFLNTREEKEGNITTVEEIVECSKVIRIDPYDGVNNLISFELQKQDGMDSINFAEFRRYIKTENNENIWVYLMNDNGKTINSWFLENYTMVWLEDQLEHTVAKE